MWWRAGLDMEASYRFFLAIKMPLGRGAHSGEGDHAVRRGDHLIRSMTTRAAHELDGAVGCSF
jgi:hypothetical protein